jgi:hypothetical protein
MNMLKKPASIIAATLLLGVGTGTVQAAFLEPGTNGTITVTAGCFTFGACAVGGLGNIEDNATIVNGVGSGIAGDGIIGQMNFTVGLDGNSISLTSFNMDSYDQTAGGWFGTRLVDTSNADGVINDDGSMTLNLTGRTGSAEFFPAFGELAWNLDTHGATQPACTPGTGVYTLFTTGTSSNINCVTGAAVTSLTGVSLGQTGPNTWTGTLVSAGNVGSVWPGFDGVPYTEIFVITVTGTAATCSPDTCPDNFSFTAQTDVGLNQLVVSNSQTITGIVNGTPISVTGGEYQIGGDPNPWTSNPGTIDNNQQVRVRHTSSALNSTSVMTALTVGNLTRNFVSTTIGVAPSTGVIGNNFTMLDKAGGVTGGTNDVQVTWDGSENTDVSSTNFNMTLTSTEPFFQYTWNAHHIRVFGPGTYRIDTTCTVAELEAGTSVCNNPLQILPTPQTQQFYDFVVGPGQLAAHMLFDWNIATNIDVVLVWDQGVKFGPSTMHTGEAGCNNPETLWDLMSTDWDGDGQNGAAMIDGPFMGFKANFNLMITGAALSCEPIIQEVNVDDPSGATGCSISQKPASLLERGDWWLVAGFLVWLGGIRVRSKRHQIKA